MVIFGKMWSFSVTCIRMKMWVRAVRWFLQYLLLQCNVPLLKSEYYNPSIQPEYTTQQSMKYVQHSYGAKAHFRKWRAHFTISHCSHTLDLQCLLPGKRVTRWSLWAHLPDMMSAWGMLSSGLVQRSPREQHQEHDKQSVIQMCVMVKDIVPTCRVCISPLGTPTRYVDMLLRGSHYYRIIYPIKFSGTWKRAYYKLDRKFSWSIFITYLIYIRTGKTEDAL
jgi:hypothetical protein